VSLLFKLSTLATSALMFSSCQMNNNKDLCLLE